MKLSEFVEGLSILRPHYTGGDGYTIGAEHDQIYLYATDTPLTGEEVARMRELGWFQPGRSDEPYDEQESWSAFF